MCLSHSWDVNHRTTALQSACLVWYNSRALFPRKLMSSPTFPHNLEMGPSIRKLAHDLLFEFSPLKKNNIFHQFPRDYLTILDSAIIEAEILPQETSACIQLQCEYYVVPINFKLIRKKTYGSSGIWTCVLLFTSRALYNLTLKLPTRQQCSIISHLLRQLKYFLNNMLYHAVVGTKL